MPKQKTVKAISKRMKATRNGKVKHYPTGKSHLLQTKSRKQKRRIKKNTGIQKSKLSKRLALALNS